MAYVSYVSHDSLSDITAIWNTNAFFAYIITVQLFKLDWEPRKLFAVLIATFGVIAVVYGDARQSVSPHNTIDQLAYTSKTVMPKAPVLGDLLTLCASIGYGLYQVLYNRHAALHPDQEVELGTAYVLLQDSDGLPAGELGESDKVVDLTYPPPFGLYPNLLASGIGFMTLFLLWIILPILHYSGYERFRVPDNPTVVLSIAGVAVSGLVFNAGLLVHSFLLFCTRIDRVFALSDFVGYLGPHRCLCRQPPHDRSCPPIRHLDGARYGSHHAVELGRLRWDHSGVRHLGLRYGSSFSISHLMYTFYLTPRGHTTPTSYPLHRTRYSDMEQRSPSALSHRLV